MAITREEARAIRSARTLVTLYRDRVVQSIISRTREAEKEYLDDAAILLDEIVARIEAGAPTIKISDNPGPCPHPHSNFPMTLIAPVETGK